MTDWPLVAVRFALYADLGLVFGWPLFHLYMLRGAEHGTAAGPLPSALPLILFSLAGLLFSALGFGLLAAAMGGTGLSGVDFTIVGAVLEETALGKAFQVRMAALTLAAVGAILAIRAPRWGLAVAASAGAVALGSLAWSGHAAATEGPLAFVHLGSDVLHLWAAGLWLGALFALLAMVAPRRADPIRLGLAHQALADFSRLGTLAVLVLLASGIINGLLILGTFKPDAILATSYGRLLFVKLALFALMLALAAANRFRLTPALGSALREDSALDASASRLRLSLAAETVAALVILTIVGWLGTLEPPGS